MYTTTMKLQKVEKRSRLDNRINVGKKRNEKRLQGK